MAGEFTLAKAFVEISAKGLQGLQASLQGMRGSVQAMAAGVASAFTGLAAVLDRTQSGIRGITAVASSAYGSGVRLITSTAATASPVVFERFQFALRDLSAVIGQAFVPTMERVIAFIYKVADAILNLDPITKDHLATWIVWGTAVAGFVSTIPTVLGGVQALVGVFVGLGEVLSVGPIGALITVVSLMAAVASGASDAGGGVGGLIGMFQGVVSALQPLFDAFRDLWEALEPLFVSLGQVLAQVAALIVPALTMVVNILTAVVRAIRSALEWLGVRFSPTEHRPRQDRQYRSSFGLGGGGNPQLGAIESGHWNALLAGMRAPTQSEQYLRDIRDLLRNMQNQGSSPIAVSTVAAASGGFFGAFGGAMGGHP